LFVYIKLNLKTYGGKLRPKKEERSESSKSDTSGGAKIKLRELMLKKLNIT
jgi:hypothetical protein